MDFGTPSSSGPGGSWRLASVGMELAGAVIGGCLLGYWIDIQFDTGRWGLIIGAGIGIVGGLYNMIRKALRESLESGASGAHRRGPTEAQKRDDSGDPPTSAGSP